MWVYIRTEPTLWTVGFFDPEGIFTTDSDWETKEEARAQVSYLNGGTAPENL